MSKILLVLTNDKIGRKLINCLESNFYDVPIYLDKSSTLNRVMKLLLKRRISFRHFCKMAIASIIRRDYFVRNYPSIRSNDDLIAVINEKLPEVVYFFRAGLIINRTVINKNVSLINIHCSSLPKYRGIASIGRALDEKAYMQYAIMHRITEDIDSGEIFRAEPYVMLPGNSYQKNEDVAYEAGIKLLLQELSTKVNR